jgi:hypothetical protein
VRTFLTVTGAGGDTLNAFYKQSKNVGTNAPLLIDVYGGPGSQRVRQTHDASTKGEGEGEKERKRGGKEINLIINLNLMLI